MDILEGPFKYHRFLDQSAIQGSPLVTTAFIPAKNCPYKRDVVTSMHFTITNPHLILFGPSKFCRYIQICSYKHGRYKRASLYLAFTMSKIMNHTFLLDVLQSLLWRLFALCNNFSPHHDMRNSFCDLKTMFSVLQIPK